MTPIEKHHLHYNNSSKSEQSPESIAMKLLNQILKGNGEFTLSVDDGDGDVWKYTISVDSERVEAIKTPITEN